MPSYLVRRATLPKHLRLIKKLQLTMSEATSSSSKLLTPEEQEEEIQRRVAKRLAELTKETPASKKKRTPPPRKVSTDPAEVEHLKKVKAYKDEMMSWRAREEKRKTAETEASEKTYRELYTELQMDRKVKDRTVKLYKQPAEKQALWNKVRSEHKRRENAKERKAGTDDRSKKKASLDTLAEKYDTKLSADARRELMKLPNALQYDTIVKRAAEVTKAHGKKFIKGETVSIFISTIR